MLAMRACWIARGGARPWHAAPGLPAPRRLAALGAPPLARPSPRHRTLGGASGHTRPVIGTAARKAQQAAGGAEAGEASPKVDGRTVQGALRREAARKAKAGLELTDEEARAHAVVKAAAAAAGARSRAVARKAKAGLELTDEEARLHEQLLRRGDAIEAAAQKVAEGAPLSPEEASLYKATQMKGMKRGGKRDLPRGVHVTKSGRYRARIGVRTGGVQRTEYLGTFDTPYEAACAFDEAAIRRWQAGLVPELVTNYPPEGYPGYTGVGGPGGTES